MLVRAARVSPNGTDGGERLSDFETGGKAPQQRLFCGLSAFQVFSHNGVDSRRLIFTRPRRWAFQCFQWNRPDGTGGRFIPKRWIENTTRLMGKAKG